MRAWLIHERCFSVLIAQDKTWTVRWSQEMATSRNTRAGSIFKKAPVARGALLDIALSDIALLEKEKCWNAQERSQRDCRIRAPACSDEAAALNSNLRWHTVMPTVAKMLSCRHSRGFAEGLAPKRKADVHFHELSFYTRAEGGVYVAKHARQLSLAWFVNTRRWLGSLARFHLHQSLLFSQYVERDWLKGNWIYAYL